MTEFLEIAGSASTLAGSIGSALLALSCWRLSNMEKGKHLMAAMIASIVFFLTNGFYCLTWLAVQPPFLHLDLVSGLYQFEILWDATAHLYYISLSVVLLSLARWFYLRLPPKSATDQGCL